MPWHFLPVQQGRNLVPFPTPTTQCILYFSQFHHIFKKKKNEGKKKCHKRKKQKQSVNLHVLIDHAVFVTTCSCKQLLVTGVLVYLAPWAACPPGMKLPLGSLPPHPPPPGVYYPGVSCPQPWAACPPGVKLPLGSLPHRVKIP